MACVGRPTKYTPQRIARLLRSLAAGNTRRAACAAAGISTDTLATWLRDYPDFSAQITRAEDEAEAMYASVIERAAGGHEVTITRETTEPDADGLMVIKRTVETRREYDWRAAQFWLSRRRSDDWGDKTKLEHAGKVQVEDVSPDAAAARKLIALIREKPELLDGLGSDR